MSGPTSPHQSQYTAVAAADDDRITTNGISIGGGGGGIGGGEMRAAALDCNLVSLCDHVQSEGFNQGSFSDIVVRAMDSSFRLHRLVLSRSSYFRNMLQGPWKEATSSVVTLQIDDKNVNEKAIAMALAYLYGLYPKLNDNNAFRVLAAASFLDLQDLCAICTDFIISELWSSNFLAYQAFAENQDYGVHGERVRVACWGYLCQCGAMELKEMLPKLSSQTLHALLTSNELWLPSEEKRFELALYTLLKKSALGKGKNPENESSAVESGIDNCPESSASKGKDVLHCSCCRSTEADVGLVHQVDCTQPDLRPSYPSNMEQPSTLIDSLPETDINGSSSSYAEMPFVLTPIGQTRHGAPVEGPLGENLCSSYGNNSWLAVSESRQCNEMTANEWNKYNLPLSWGGRIVARRQVKCFDVENCGLGEEEYDTFINIFEGGSLLYCSMSFEALLNVRKQLEELGFPCKAVNDGLWLQMLLSQRVQETAADTCRICCLFGASCACRHSFAVSHGVGTVVYNMQAPDQQYPPGNIGNLYVADSAQGEGNGVFRPVRVQVRGSNDGLAGIGRGATFVPAGAWPPTRFVFSRVPLNVGNRTSQQALANDDPEVRVDQHGDLSGDGLTALVGLSEGGRNMINIPGQTERDYELEIHNSLVRNSAAGRSDAAVQMTETSEPDAGIHWENAENASISLDMKTPLSHFPPFRFGVEFEDVHRLSDGQVKHSPEAFYAGSLWKVSVQAFNDEDPQGRRTLGLFIHRRKAEVTDPLRKAHMYVDAREKVTARYQLICPSKREVMVFGSFKQAGNLLPKAPKGWGWRTALLFDELPDLLQSGCLRVCAVLQLV
ncbi:Germ cell-less protein-like 1-like protein [Drosera capensis]